MIIAFAQTKEMEYGDIGPMYNVIFLIIMIYTTCIQPMCLKYVLRQGWHVHLVVHVAISHIIQDFSCPIILVTKPYVIGLVELMSLSRAMNIQM